MPATDRLKENPEEAPAPGEASQATEEAKGQPASEVAEAPPEGEAATAPEEEAAAPKGRGKKGEKGEKGEAAPKDKGARKVAKQARSTELAGYTPRLKDKYRGEVAPTLLRELGLDNPMEVPGITKVVVNIGMGESLTNPKAMENANRDLATITGQHPVTTKAKKSVAAFKIRQGMPIGLMVTLRGNHMYEFLDRLMNIALPRIRDFRGVPNNGFDGRGNYTLGMREHVVFPEIDYNDIDRIRGLQLTIVTTANTDDAARRLLSLMGLVFSRETEAAVA